MKNLFLSLGFTIILGCGGGIPMHVVMTNPTTGQSMYISHAVYSTNLGVHITAVQEQQRAIEAARMMGYTEIKEVR